MTNWPALYRKLMEGGWKLDQIRTITVAQWWGILQKDGPGSETVTEFRTREDFLRWKAERAARKGEKTNVRASADLPAAATNSVEGGEMATELKPGVKVLTPHGKGEVVREMKEENGWAVRRDGASEDTFYHAWDLKIVPALKVKLTA